MTQVAHVARLGLFTTFAIALASACGGQSFTGNGSSAGTSSGGGSPVTACDAAPETGMCEAYIPSWYHEPSTGICRPFVYGGCGGNDNRYPTLEACQKACPSGNPNYDVCKLPSDCLVTGVGCCGICDGPNITAHDLIAYNREYAGFLQCGVPFGVAGNAAEPGVAAPIACAPCPAPLPGQGTLQYFVPDCLAGQCAVTDLRTSPVTACKSNEECKLRYGLGCCEGCGPGDVAAVRNDGSFEQLVCGSGDVACDACAPQPIDAVAYCGAEGHCEVGFFVDAAQ